MKNCVNCGQQVDENAKFCANCGASLASTNGAQRKIVYDGEIHKCPNCGELLKTFEGICSSCGFEIRGRTGSAAVESLSEKLENANSDEQRIVIVKTFPVPNTKEDIFEFFILASTNINSMLSEELLDAWKTKIEQCYTKATLTFRGDSDYKTITSLYEKANATIKMQSKAKKSADFKSYLPQLVVVIGWLISIFILIPLSGTNLDGVGFNPCQLLLMLDLISGIFFIPKVVKINTNIPKFVAVIGQIISLIVLIILSSSNLDSVGFNAYQLILISNVIASTIIFIRIFKKSK